MAVTMRARRIGAATNASSCPPRWASACSWTRRRIVSTSPCRGATTPPRSPIPPRSPTPRIPPAAHGTPRRNPPRPPPEKTAGRPMPLPPPTSPATRRRPRRNPVRPPPPGKATARRKMRTRRKARTRPKAASGHAASRPGCAGPDRARWPSTWTPSLPADRPASSCRAAAASPWSASSGRPGCQPSAAPSRPGRCLCSR